MRKVPKLRFKEFNDEWEENKLGDISKITSGLTPLRSEEKFYLNGVIPWVKTSDLNNSYIKETEEKISEFALKETSIKLLPKNTLLVAMYGGFNQIGRTGLTTIEATTNQALSAIKFRDINKFPLFFQNVLNYKVDYWKKVSASSRKDPNITKKDIEDFKVIYPKLEEQEKIASFLSSVDKKISLIEGKLELFREYKKGIMQKIFSQELRFKDSNGNDYPEWEEKRLGDILIKNKEKNKNNQYTLVQSISNKYGFVNQEEYFEDRKIASNNLSNYYIIKNKNFAYNPSRINVGSLAYKKDFSISVISPLYVSFYADNSYVNDIFLLNWLFSFPFYRQMNSSFEGSVRNNLSYDALSSFNILLPILEEQQKIADFLSSIDNKIESIEKELEGLKEFKKGLFQQMFV